MTSKERQPVYRQLTQSVAKNPQADHGSFFQEHLSVGFSQLSTSDGTTPVRDPASGTGHTNPSMVESKTAVRLPAQGMKNPLKICQSSARLASDMHAGATMAGMPTYGGREEPFCFWPSSIYTDGAAGCESSVYPAKGQQISNCTTGNLAYPSMSVVSAGGLAIPGDQARQSFLSGSPTTADMTNECTLSSRTSVLTDQIPFGGSEAMIRDSSQISYPSSQGLYLGTMLRGSSNLIGGRGTSSFDVDPSLLTSPPSTQSVEMSRSPMSPGVAASLPSRDLLSPLTASNMTRSMSGRSAASLASSAAASPSGPAFNTVVCHRGVIGLNQSNSLGDPNVGRSGIPPSPETQAPAILEASHLSSPVPIPRTRNCYTKSVQEKVTCGRCDRVFKGDHELRRHKLREHGKSRKVWIAVDSSEDKKFLAHCKSCKSGKRYLADYNLAAHLRRIHFYPCERRGGEERHRAKDDSNGRGSTKGKAKKAEMEKRGGKGGGKDPPMSTLKQFWMREVVERVRQGEKATKKGRGIQKGKGKDKRKGKGKALVDATDNLTVTDLASEMASYSDDIENGDGSLHDETSQVGDFTGRYTSNAQMGHVSPGMGSDYGYIKNIAKNATTVPNVIQCNNANIPNIRGLGDSLESANVGLGLIFDGTADAESQEYMLVDSAVGNSLLDGSGQNAGVGHDGDVDMERGVQEAGPSMTSAGNEIGSFMDGHYSEPHRLQRFDQQQQRQRQFSGYSGPHVSEGGLPFIGSATSMDEVNTTGDSINFTGYNANAGLNIAAADIVGGDAVDASGHATQSFFGGGAFDTVNEEGAYAQPPQTPFAHPARAERQHQQRQGHTGQGNQAQQLQRQRQRGSEQMSWSVAASAGAASTRASNSMSMNGTMTDSGLMGSAVRGSNGSNSVGSIGVHSMMHTHDESNIQLLELGAGMKEGEYVDSWDPELLF